ncbi:MAG: ferredoxin--NADP reductase [Pseudomonadota bacterium]|nr:ferredoxin--NADP reductase [Pseudomonadota bacterium]
MANKPNVEVDNTIEIQDLPLPNSLTQETVLSVEHWTDHLFSFHITRPQAFRFRSGEFIMLGLFVNEKPLLRAYSVTSPTWDEKLEFLSIKVENGPLTSRLVNIQPGDKILLGKKPTGTLTLDAITPANTLYMIATGTGIAPFASLIRDPETFDKFDDVVLTHTCRTVAELEYGKSVVSLLKSDPLVAEFAKNRVTYFSSVTQEKYDPVGRITTLIDTKELFRNIGKPPLNSKTDRVMICGSIDMLKDVATLVEASGLKEGSNADPADFLIEKAFAE